jgi:hypothetical protein
MSSDVEFHGGWIVQGVWDEHWTETYTELETYTDSKGNSQTRLVTKTRYHPDSYIVLDSNNYNVNINEVHFEELCEKFGNRKINKPWRSGQSSWGDGRQFTTVWPGNELTFTPCFTSHKYKNKVIRSNSVFNFKDVTKEEKDNLGLYEYPPIYNYYQQDSILGWYDNIAEQTLTKANAKLGAVKQVRIFILVFKDKSIEAALAQQRYWKNGNKNEVVVCVGLHDNKISWVFPFAWDNERLLVDIREEISSTSESENINMTKVVNIIIKLVNEKFNRKHFKDFDYIKSDPPTWAKFLCFISVLLVNCGISFVLVNNKYNA